MATYDHTTPVTLDAIDESLNSAKWFLTTRRFLMAPETLRSAALLCRDDCQPRIQGLVSALEGARLPQLVGA